MEDWLESLKKDIEKFHNTDWGKLTDKEFNRKEGARIGGLMSSPGKEGRLKLSELKKNQKFSKKHRESLKKSKLKHKITKEQILEAQSKHQFGKDIAKELGVAFNTYKSIAEHHGVYKTLGEHNTGRINAMKTAKPIKVWKYNKETKSVGEFVGQFESVSDANRQLGTTSGLKKVADGIYKQAKGYYGEWVKK